MRGADYFMRRRDQGPMSSWRERLRFLLLLLGFGFGVLLFAAWNDDSVRLAAAAGVGVWLATYGMVDLIWLATGDVERIWSRTRSQSRWIAVLMLIVGIVLFVVGLGSQVVLIA